jgi:hypothetical protein
MFAAKAGQHEVIDCLLQDSKVNANIGNMVS